VRPAPLRGLGALAIPEQAARRHGTGTGHAAQSPYSGGDGLPLGELVGRHRGASPRRMMAPPRRCQGIKCPRTGVGARVRSALERGGPSSRAERTLERGGARSREAHPLERDGARPREARILERGEDCSRGSSSGSPWCAVGASSAWAVSCMVKRGVFGFDFVAGFKWGFPSCLRGPLGLSPTVAPEHLWVCH
jgi:hypothetical protein